MAEEGNTDLVIIIGSIFLVFLGLSIGIIISLSKRIIQGKENKIRLIEREKQVELLTSTAKAVESEKIKLATQLHDEILPIINNAASNTAGIILSLEKQGIEMRGLKNELKAFPLLHESIREVIHEIVPQLFTSFGLLKAIEVYIREMNKGKISIAEFHNNTTFSGEPPFSINDQLIIFNICREVLNNLQKHSNYEYLNISLEEVTDNFTILFSHDGNGITNEQIKEFRESSTGMGLKLLESRSILLNAELNYSLDNAASYIRLKVPIKND
jgi:two-component system NarL family sensor kinase